MSIKKRRDLIGQPCDMMVYASQILEVPGGRRDAVRRATQSAYTPNLLTKTALCNNPADNLYLEELIELSKYADPRSNLTTKPEICLMLRRYAANALETVNSFNSNHDFNSCSNRYQLS